VKPPVRADTPGWKRAMWPACRLRGGRAEQRIAADEPYGAILDVLDGLLERFGYRDEEG